MLMGPDKLSMHSMKGDFNTTDAGHINAQIVLFWPGLLENVGYYATSITAYGRHPSIDQAEQHCADWSLPRYSQICCCPSLCDQSVIQLNLALLSKESCAIVLKSALMCAHASK